MKEVSKYSHCFVCGDQNPIGLKAKFMFDGEQAITELTADERFEGYRGIYHGGIISALLDEVMIKAILAEDIFAVTAEMTVRYHRPARVGDHLTFTGKKTTRKGRLYVTEGAVTTQNGDVLATATGKYIEAKGDFKDELTNSVE